MKKSIKLISLLLISVAMILIGKENVFASDNAPSTFTAVSSKMKKNPKGLETNNISVKKTSDGKYIYCYDVNDLVPNGIKYTKKTLITDPIVNYIVAQGLTQDNTEEKFFSTQAALWIYLLEKGQMKDTQYGYINKIKTAMKNYPNDAVYARISGILSDSKKYSEITMAEVEIESNNASFTLKNGYYVSTLIKVNKASANYNVTLINAPTGTKVEKSSDGFIVSVPESSVSNGTIKFTATATANKYVSYIYSSGKTGYQEMLSAYPVETTDTINLTIKKEVSVTPTPTTPVEKDVTKVVISKQDITNKGVELPGATLVIKNSKGEVVEEWVSTNKAHEFDSLEVGTYTLTETIAPEGYELSSETISFTVKKDGKIVTKVMYNTPKIEEEIINNKVVISKQDITTKEELEGATLVVKNNKGEELYRWVSGKEAYVIEHLDEGTYTLTEIQSPNGYVLSEEVITFEIVNGKVVTEVVMFNTPLTSEIVDVPATGALASSLPYLIGGLVIIMGSVLLYKNAKKEQ